MKSPIDDKFLNRVPYFPRLIFNRLPPKNPDTDSSNEEPTTSQQESYRPPRPAIFEPVHHEDRPEILTTVRAKLIVSAVMFDGENAKHHLIEEPDGSRRMHSVEFEDKSGLYFETEPDGHLEHLMSDCFLELRDGVLVASAMSVREAAQKEDSEDDPER